MNFMVLARETKLTVDIDRQPNYGQRPPEYDAPEPVIYKEAGTGHIPIGKRKKNKIPKHLRREVTEKEIDGFTRRV
ncbi:hypothetical protein F2Q70_00038934 [Brassica cretica]|uniref:Uncharacterized protein n=1 Tax=Brassica cretica TaxID=69181 RepID=A0A8S9MMF4_BRACR|nr:hypothetical protein F2Q70_00038934 [Brassica cretica]KAF2619338.1 hypothetical protein F2Q68_00039624 [Brassica cretica]